MKHLKLFLGILLSVSLNSFSQEKPNILFIAIDDLNDWVGCMKGHPQAKTPNIDKLAAQGTLFTNAHCQAPICGPSRASVMSGLYPHNSGNYLQLDDTDIKKSNDIAQKAIFLPDYFETYGYKTLAVGKIFHRGDQVGAFDEYGGSMGHTGPKPKTRFNYDPAWYNKNGTTQTDWGAYPERDEMMPDHKYATWISEKLQMEHDRPFFMAVGFNRPHVPWYVPQKWFDKFPLDSITLPPYLKTDMNDVPLMGQRVADASHMPTTEWMIKENQWKKVVQAYMACVSFVDHQVGRVLNALENSKYKGNTIIVLWSDHGYHLGEKNRVAKQALWERNTRTLLAFKVPGGNSGQISHRTAQLLDIYPTLVDLAGLPDNTLNDGRSLKPLLIDPDKEWPYPAITSYGRNNTAISTERYRLIMYEDGSSEFYDLKKDPNEWKNLQGKRRYKIDMEQLKSHIPNERAALSRYTKYKFNAYFRALISKNNKK